MCKLPVRFEAVVVGVIFARAYRDDRVQLMGKQKKNLFLITNVLDIVYRLRRLRNPCSKRVKILKF